MKEGERGGDHGENGAMNIGGQQRAHDAAVNEGEA